MKRIICFLLAFLMLLSFSTAFSATETTPPTMEESETSPNNPLVPDWFDKLFPENVEDTEGIKDKLNDDSKDLPDNDVWDWIIGEGANPTKMNIAQYYASAGISTTEFPFYIISYSSLFDFSFGCGWVNVFFLRDNPNGYITVNDYRSVSDRFADYDIVLGGGCVSKEFFLYSDGSVKLTGQVNSTLYASCVDLRVFSDSGYGVPPSASIYYNNSSYASGSKAVYASNFKIKTEDGIELKPPEGGDTGDEENNDGLGFDPEDIGLKDFVPPDIPDINPYINDYGPIVGPLLWLCATIRNLFLCLLENVVILCHNILCIPKILMLLLKSLFESLFIPDETFVDQLKTEITTAFNAKFPFISGALDVLSDVFTEASGQTVSASSYNSAMGIPTEVSSVYNSDSIPITDTNVSFYSGGTAPKFVFHYNTWKGESVIDFAPFLPYMNLVRCITSAFLMLAFVRHVLQAIPAILGRIPSR